MKHLTDYLEAHGVPSEEAADAFVDAEVFHEATAAKIATDSEHILAAMAEQASDELGWVWTVHKCGAICPVGSWLPNRKDWEFLVMEDRGLSPVELLALLHGRNLMTKGGTNG